MRDQLLGQVVMEIGDEHGWENYTGSMASELQLRRSIVEIGDWLHVAGFVAGAEGNISARIDSKRIVVTPTGVSKRRMKARDLVIVDLEGKRIRTQSSRRNASSEVEMHLQIYRTRRDVNAVVHAHPPTATGFAVARRALDRPLVPEVMVALRKIPLAPYVTPGTLELGQAVARLAAEHDAILLANHGVVTCGEGLNAAYLKMEIVEQFAKIFLAAEQAGGAKELSIEEMRNLLQLRESYFARIKT